MITDTLDILNIIERFNYQTSNADLTTGMHFISLLMFVRGSSLENL